MTTRVTSPHGPSAQLTPAPITNGISVIATFFAWCDPRRNPGTDGIARHTAQHRVCRNQGGWPRQIAANADGARDRCTWAPGRAAAGAFREREIFFMHASFIRVSAASGAAVALSIAGVSGASAAGTPTKIPGRAPAATAAAGPGTQAWIQRYNGTKAGTDHASSVAVSPSGGTVYVTGESHAPGAIATVYDYATIAYDAATGARLWIQRYNGPGNGDDRANSIAVSPTGGTVYVTGQSDGGAATSSDYATVAYDAATGAQLWIMRYDGPGHSTDQANSVSASPDGKTVYVTGYSVGAGSGDYATVAYDAATGAQLWIMRYDGPGHNTDQANSVSASPDGKAVYVTGYSAGSSTADDYATIAYNAATGAQLWVKRYDGPGHVGDEAWSLAVSPSGETVFVTGNSRKTSQSGCDYTTVAYNGATGAQRWVKRYSGPHGGYNYAASMAVSPTGATVYVTGQSHAAGNASNSDYATVAYDATTGAQLWAQRYNGPGNATDGATSVAVSHTGGTVYVTGESFGGTAPWYDYATVAYDAGTGAQLWLKRYNGPGNATDQGNSVAASPTENRVFVTGYSAGATTGDDYTTIGYNG
jgi:WD40 repeat protein